MSSNDLHVMEHARGDANGRKNSTRVIGSEFYLYADRNEVHSKSLVRLRPKVRRWEARLRTLPKVAEAEQKAWDWFKLNFQNKAPNPMA